MCTVAVLAEYANRYTTCLAAAGLAHSSWQAMVPGSAALVCTAWFAGHQAVQAGHARVHHIFKAATSAAVYHAPCGVECWRVAVSRTPNPWAWFVEPAALSGAHAAADQVATARYACCVMYAGAGSACLCHMQAATQPTFFLLATSGFALGSLPGRHKPCLSSHMLGLLL